MLESQGHRAIIGNHYGNLVPILSASQPPPCKFYTVETSNSPRLICNFFPLFPAVTWKQIIVLSGLFKSQKVYVYN